MPEPVFLFAPVATHSAMVWDVLVSDVSIPDAAARFGLPVTESSAGQPRTRLYRVGTLVAVLKENGTLDHELGIRATLTEAEEHTLLEAVDGQLAEYLEPRGRFLPQSSKPL